MDHENRHAILFIADVEMQKKNIKRKNNGLHCEEILEFSNKSRLMIYKLKMIVFMRHAERGDN